MHKRSIAILLSSRTIFKLRMFMCKMRHPIGTQLFPRPRCNDRTRFMALLAASSIIVLIKI